jgi:hypothetical protein
MAEHGAQSSIGVPPVFGTINQRWNFTVIPQIAGSC